MPSVAWGLLFHLLAVDTTARKHSDAPNFFSVLSLAEEIQVQEVNAKDSTHRSFIVNVRAPNEKPAPAESKPRSSEKPDRNYVLQSAARLMASNDFLLARNLYSFLLKTNIRDEAALYGLGVCFFRLGDIPSSKRCFRASWELFQRADSIYWLGLCEVQQKNDTAALNCFAKLEDPARLEASIRFDYFKEYGNCETRTGAFERAETHYLEALKLRPHSDVILVNLGTLELQREQLQKAENLFQDALSLNPNSSKAHCGLGILHLMRHEAQKAENRFLTALDLDSQNQAALLELVSMAHQQNSFAQIKPRLTRFLIREPGNHAIRYQLAVCLFRDGSWTACEKEVDQILANDPKHEGSIKLKHALIKQKHTQGVHI